MDQNSICAFQFAISSLTRQNMPSLKLYPVNNVLGGKRHEDEWEGVIVSISWNGGMKWVESLRNYVHRLQKPLPRIWFQTLSWVIHIGVWRTAYTYVARRLHKWYDFFLVEVPSWLQFGTVIPPFQVQLRPKADAFIWHRCPCSVSVGESERRGDVFVIEQKG